MTKKLVWTVLALALSGAMLQAAEMKSAAPAQAKGNTAIQPEISPEMIQYAISTNRRAIFEAAMEDLLTAPALKSAFWEVFNAYEIEKAGIADARMNILAEYINNFTTMSDVKVKELLKSSFNTQSKELKIRKKFAGQLTKKANATIAGRFWQVDDFISSAVKVGLLANVPLLGEEIK